MNDESTVTEVLFECYECSDAFSDIDSLTPGPTGEAYCDDCFNDMFSFCDWCEEYEMSGTFSSAYNSRGNEIMVCAPCIENGEFTACESCYEIYLHDYMVCRDEGCYCEACAEDDDESSPRASWVRGYHDNPMFQFIRDDGSSDTYMDSGTYYLGVEIELERSVTLLRENGFIPEQGVFRNLWACYDGSLNTDGIELITMPGTLEAWRRGYVIPWAEWYDQVHSIIPKQQQFYSNGIHVHVSRAAFARPIFNGHRGFKESAAHLFKFLMFIERNELVMHHIGGRTERSSYAKFNAKEAKANRKRIVKKEAYADRYNIVNVGNRHTIELRFFDGRSDTEFIKRAVELTHAMVEYTRGASTKTSSMEFTAFMDWVMQRRVIYPALWAYVMGKLPLLKKIADQSQLDYDAMTYEIQSKPLDIQDRFQRNRVIRDGFRDRTDLRDQGMEYSTPDGSYGECGCGFCETVFNL